MTARGAEGRVASFAAGVGRRSLHFVESFGFGASLFAQSLYWAVLGRRQGQPVRLASVVQQMMETGIGAIPIVTVLSATIGLMLALQGIHALQPFGAQRQVTLGVALSVVREFGPLITGIIVAGRSGSALAARLGSMTINEEIDALRVMGIHPVRFLVAPNLIATLVMVPALTLWANTVALTAAGLYVTSELGIGLGTFADEVIRFLDLDDLTHGLTKSVIFGALITLVGVVNGTRVSGGAEGVGRVTTSSVVQSIAAIVVADGIFVYAAIQS
jgi:phospholipid/cholesterol/gamma-HCH transport system permease protein